MSSGNSPETVKKKGNISPKMGNKVTRELGTRESWIGYRKARDLIREVE